MRNLMVALLLLLSLALLSAGCGRRGAADPDAAIRAEITRYGLAETVARARDAVNARPSPETYDRLARALAAGRQPKPAREALQKAVSLDPTYPPSAVMLGRVLLEERKAPATEQMMRAVIAKHPEDVSAHELLARALLRENRGAEALAAAQEGLKRTGRSAELLWAQADAEAVLKQYEQARKDYLRALRLKPHTVGLHLSYVQTLMAMGQPEQAAKAALETVKLEPNSADVRFMAATILHRGGHLDEALAQYKEALVINPSLVPAANNLALLLADRGQDTGTAVAWARKAAALQPKSVAVADTLGWALARDGRYQEGLGILQKVNGAWSGQPTVWYHLGWTLLKAGRGAEGRRWLQQAAASGSEISADARKALGEAG